MPENNIEQRIVFALGRQPSEPVPVLIVGIPAGAWEYMRDGKTNTLDLTSAGVPVKLIMFGAENHDAALKVLHQAAAAAGSAALDLRREDFSLKPTKGDGDAV